MSCKMKSLSKNTQSKPQGLTQRIKQALQDGSQLVGYSLLLSHLTFIPYVHAGPSGGVVVGGAGGISQSGLTTTINQNSSSLAINWNSFNLNSDEVVNFIQPGASSIALNRIIGDSASQIHGQINANGQVVLVNTNGIFFGSTASVNVGGLIASGLDISPADFMNGDYIFSSVDGTTGAVINGGILNASLGGSITLLGKQVSNEGLISANLGAVNLAAGHEAVLTFDAEGLMGVHITREVLQDELGIDPAVLNNGIITAESGRILLTASQSQDVFSQAVNHEGINQASSVVMNEDGSFTLGAGADVVNNGVIDASSQISDTEQNNISLKQDGSYTLSNTIALNEDGSYSVAKSDTSVNNGSISTTTVGNSNSAGKVIVLGENITNSGLIKADAENANGGDIELQSRVKTLLTENSEITARSESKGQGGIVKILGDKVGVMDQSTVDVSGAEGGGQILIGGDFQGSNSRIRNATRTYVSQNSQLFADALQTGNGGKIINWSDESTWFYGSASAKGGSVSGDGGLVEISGKNLSFNGTVDTSAISGEIGTLLFDPTDIVIYDSACIPGPCTTQTNDTELDDATILDTESTASVFNISEAKLESLSFDADIILQATNNITIQELITDHILKLKSTTGSITITADSDGVGGGVFSMNSADKIETQGGDVVISGASVNVGSIDTQGAAAGGTQNGNSGGSIAINSGTNVTVSGTLITNGGNGGGSGDNTGGSAGSVDIQAVSGISVASISAVGGNSDGNDTAGTGGLTILSTTTGDIIASGNISSNGGAANGSGTGGVAGILTLTSSAGALSAGGNISADGGISATGTDGNAAAIGLNSTAGLMTLKGNVSAVGNNDANITINAQTLRLDGAVAQAIRGNLTTITSASSLQLLQSLTIDADSNAVINADIDYNGIPASSSLTVQALDHITITGDISDSNLTTADQLNVILNADDNVGGSGDLNINGSIATGGGSFSTTGVNYDAQSSATNKYTINTGAAVATINMTGNVDLGEMVVGTLSVIADGYIAQGSANTDSDDLAVTGTSLFRSISSASDNITLNSDNNVLDGAISLYKIGNNGSDITLNNNATLTTLDAVTVRGDLFVNAQQNLSLTGALSADTSSGIHSADLFFGLNNLDATYTQALTSSLTATSSGGNVMNITINGGSGDNSFNFNSGSTVSLSNNDSLTINGGSGVDTFNVDVALPATIIGAGGNDILNGSDNANNWTVTGLNAGTLKQTALATVTNFTDIELINGGIDTDILTGPNATVTWTIGTVSGNLKTTENLLGTGFTNIDNYTGGTGNDRFNIQSGASFGVITGGSQSGGEDVLDVSLRTTNVIRVGTDIVGIERVIGNNAGLPTDTDNTTLIAENLVNTWTVTAINDGELSNSNGTVIFENVNNVTGNLNVDTFSFNSGSSITGTIDASGTVGDGVNDIVDYSNLLIVDISLGSDAFNGVINAESIKGNNSNSTLRGDNIDNDWDITHINDGAVVNGSGAINFIDFNNLVGGNQRDRFTFTNNNSDITGVIDGGANDLPPTRVDTLVMSAVTDPINVRLGGGSTSELDVTGIEKITGNNSDSTLYGQNLATTWNITENNDGDVNSSDVNNPQVKFIDFNNLVGNADDDDFIVSSTLDGSIIGNGGDDSLTITTVGARLWTINDTDSGIVDSAVGDGFYDIDSLIGGAGVDTFTLISGGTISGSIAGGGGSDILNSDTGDNTWDITGLNTGTLISTVSGTVSFSNIENLKGNTGTDSFTLNGGSVASIDGGTGAGINTFQAGNVFYNQWNITTNNQGNVSDIFYGSYNVSFDNIQNIVGGSNYDVFQFSDGAAITGIINGGGGTGTDTVNLQNVTTDVTVEIGDTSVQDLSVYKIYQVENVNASINVAGIINHIIADDQPNTWNINNDTKSGNVETTNFTGFNQYTGNAQADTFNLLGTTAAVAIDGGAGVAIDHVDAHLMTGLFLVDLAANDYTDIERYTGNGANSTLQADTGPNTWAVTGENDGSININTQFFDFYNLNAGDSGDMFNVSALGSLAGVATGGVGDDIVSIAIDGSRSGSFTFNGGLEATADTITLTGGHANFVGEYDSSVGIYEQLLYVEPVSGNTYAVQYANTESVTDNLVAASLTVKGTTGNDIISLGTNNFNLDTSSVTVNYSAKDVLIVDALTEAGDIIDITNNINHAGNTLSLSATTITNSSDSLITANTLILNGVVDAGAGAFALHTEVVDLELINVTGNVIINEDSQVSLNALTNVTGNLALTVTNAGDIIDGAALISPVNLQLTASNGNIRLDDANQLSGELSLVASGNVLLNNNSATLLDAVTADNLTLTTTGPITNTGTSVITASVSTNITAAGQDVILDGPGHTFTDVTVSNVGNLRLEDSSGTGLKISSINISGSADISSSGSVQLNTITAGNIASLSSSGAIIDANADATNIVANTVVLRAVNGIGDGNEIETQVAVMDIINTGSNAIDIKQTGSVELVALQNTGSLGDIFYLSNDDIYFNPGSVVANRAVGDLVMRTTRGSFLGLQTADLNNADITAHNATFFAPGTFGTFQRHLVLDVPGSVLIDTRASFNPEFIPPGPAFLDTKGIDFSILGAVSAVAGEQLVEIETLGEIDEAIFTDLQNYSQQDVSIRMPRDQMFEDELETYDR